MNKARKNVSTNTFYCNIQGNIKIVYIIFIDQLKSILSILNVWSNFVEFIEQTSNIDRSATNSRS